MGTSLSNFYNQKIKDPQSSISSVDLFIVNINSITSYIRNGFDMSLIEDDFGVFILSKHMAAIERQLQLHIRRIEEWTGSIVCGDGLSSHDDVVPYSWIIIEADYSIDCLDLYAIPDVPGRNLWSRRSFTKMTLVRFWTMLMCRSRSHFSGLKISEHSWDLSDTAAGSLAWVVNFIAWFWLFYLAMFYWDIFVVLKVLQSIYFKSRTF